MRRVCDFCGVEYESDLGRRQKYCSRFCRKKMDYKRNGGGYSGRAWRRSGIRGLSKDRGRWRITCRDASYVLFYRAVMEAHLGRHLASHEQIHHINGDPSDDRLENLELVSRSEHIKLHEPHRFSAHVLGHQARNGGL